MQKNRPRRDSNPQSSVISQSGNWRLQASQFVYVWARKVRTYVTITLPGHRDFVIFFLFESNIQLAHCSGSVAKKWRVNRSAVRVGWSTLELHVIPNTRLRTYQGKLIEAWQLWQLSGLTLYSQSECLIQWLESQAEVVSWPPSQAFPRSAHSATHELSLTVPIRSEDQTKNTV